MKKSRPLLTVVCMIFVFLMTSVKGQAISGKGTQADPYVITEYMEFPEYATRAQSDNRREVYFRLGADLESLEPYSGSKKKISVGGINGNYSTMYLDLAGHKMDVKIYEDVSLFYIDHGKLVINDTVGGGFVKAQTGDYNNIPCMPVFAFGDAGGPGMGLEIYGGTYESSCQNARSIWAENFNGSITIYDGRFKSEILVCNMDPEKPSKITIHDGDYFDFYYSTWSSEDITARIRSTKEMSRTRWMAYAKPSTDQYVGILKKILDPNTIVYLKGKVMDLSRVEGGIAEDQVEFRDPTKPRIVSQPISYKFPYVGSSHEFEITAENAENYDWRLMDENGVELSWDDVAMKCGAWSEDYYSNKFTLKDADPWLNGKRLYCIVRGNDYRIRSDYVTLQVEPVIKVIDAEIKNYAEALAGGNIGDFQTINLDYQAHGTATPAKWSLYYEEQEGMIMPYETYTISFEVELAEGYEFDSMLRCIVKTADGDVTATKLSGSTSTHAIYEFSYTPPIPKDGIKIAKVDVQIREPKAGEAPATELEPLFDVPYTVAEVKWKDDPAVFENDKSYTVYVKFRADEAYGFYRDTEFYLNGEKMNLSLVLYGTGGFAIYSLEFKVEPKGVVWSASASFSGMIGLNFYCELPEEILKDEGSYAILYKDGKDPLILPVKDAKAKNLNGRKTYVFSYPIVAKEMRDDIYFTLCYGDGRSVRLFSGSGVDYGYAGCPMSIKKYCDLVIQSGTDEKMLALAKAMIDYGTAAQLYFGYKADGLSVSNRVKNFDKQYVIDNFKYSISGEKPAGFAGFQSISLIFESATALRIYFGYEENVGAGRFSYTVDGESRKMEKTGSGQCYLQISNISAKNLDVLHKYTIAGGKKKQVLTISALSYAAILCQQTKNKPVNMGKALYLYNKAAKAYFN